MRFFVRAGVLAVAMGLVAPQSRAQVEGADEIRQILEKVAEELAEIDRLLRESGGGAAARQSAEKIHETLDQSSERSRAAQEEIQRLIEQLEQMRGQGGGGGQQQQQQQQDQQQEGQQSPQRNRQEINTPDFVPQGQPQQQQGQDQQPQGDHPQGGQETPSPGDNRTGQNPPNNETGPGQPGTGGDSWGELPPYVNFLKNRGGEPKVPEKFRKFYEAYLRSQKNKK